MKNSLQICMISMVDIRTIFFEHMKSYVLKTAANIIVNVFLGYVYGAKNE
jgi:hypothetical protein